MDIAICIQMFLSTCPIHYKSNYAWNQLKSPTLDRTEFEILFLSQYAY